MKGEKLQDEGVLGKRAAADMCNHEQSFSFWVPAKALLKRAPMAPAFRMGGWVGWWMGSDILGPSFFPYFQNFNKQSLLILKMVSKVASDFLIKSCGYLMLKNQKFKTTYLLRKTEKTILCEKRKLAIQKVIVFTTRENTIVSSES